MQAYIETGGKQFRVAVGDVIDVPSLKTAPGTPEEPATVTIAKVLAVMKEDGTAFGSPYLADASVTAEVVSEGKTKKVLVFKMKPRKGHRKLRGHRQGYTKLKIKEIQGV